MPAVTLAALRARTSPLHRRVESAVDLPRRIASREAYRALLARLLGFHAPIERALASLHARAPLPLDVRTLERTPRLRADLAALGLSPATIASLPACPFVPRPASAAEALGCLYVVEGSMLGGQAIRTMVERRLALGGRGVAFFAGDDDVGARWARFCAVLDRTVPPSDTERALDAAVATFEAFEAWVAPAEASVVARTEALAR